MLDNDDYTVSKLKTVKDIYLSTGRGLSDVDFYNINFYTYQATTEFSNARNPDNVPLDMYLGLGLAGEAGEVVDLIKKKYRGDNIEDFRSLLAEEMGDVLYYLSRLAITHNLSLEDIAIGNVKKVLVRLKRFLDEK